MPIDVPPARAPRHARDAYCGISIPISRDSPDSRVTLASDTKLGPTLKWEVFLLKGEISMLRFDNSKLKLEVNILLLLFVAILIALGALGVATKADFVLA